jgi:hypothetical protein
MADDPKPERPRVEPEIIPPGRDQSPWRSDTFTQSHGSQRIYVTKIGPFGFTLLLLALAALAAVIVVAIIGAFLIWIPVVALLVVVAAAFRFLRR